VVSKGVDQYLCKIDGKKKSSSWLKKLPFVKKNGGNKNDYILEFESEHLK
jgi:hypothetical protein